MLKHNEEYALAFQQGDEKALGYFFEELHPTLSFFANQFVKDIELANEIASEAFIKTWQKHHIFNSFQDIRAYLYTVVRRDSYKAAATVRKREVIGLSELDDTESDDTPFSFLVRAETTHLIHAALKKLSPGNKRVITMYYLEGKSTGEIARELNLHPSTVITQKERGLKALQNILHLLALSLFCSFAKIFFSTL